MVGYFLQPAPQTICSCAVIDPGRAMAGSDAVFVGTPTKVVHGRDSDLYEFQVTEVYHGEVSGTTTVGTDTGNDCATGFTIGRPSLMLVSAPHSVDAAWQAQGCGPDVSATELLATAESAYGHPHAPAGTAATTEITTWTRLEYKVPRTLQLLILAALGCALVGAYTTFALRKPSPGSGAVTGAEDKIAE